MEQKPQTIASLTADLQALRTQIATGEEKADTWYSLMTAARRINQVLLRATSEPQLFEQVCNLLAQLSGVKLIWVGLVEKGTFEVRPVTQAGFEEGYLSSIKVTWDDSEYGRGPTGTAIKTSRPAVMRDIRGDPRYEPWRKEALARGFASSIALPLVHDGDVIGALNVYSELKDAFGDEEVAFLMEVAEDIAVGVKSLRLQENLQKTTALLERLLHEIIDAVAVLSEMRDPYTSGHDKRVGELASAIAKKMGFSKDQVDSVQIAAAMHDIGKIYVPVEFLSKPGRLSELEVDLIKTHPQVGYEILKKIEFPWPIAQTVLQHHERINGSGYPLGLKDKEILLEAKIVGVADTVEAMASHRPYRPAKGLDKAFAEISENRGVLYDPGVVDACLQVFAEQRLEGGSIRIAQSTHETGAGTRRGAGKNGLAREVSEKTDGA